MPVYSISAGLDYPGIGPEHAYMAKTGRAEYYPITDKEAVDSFVYLSRMEGIIPAIESSHAIALARKIAPTMKKMKYLSCVFQDEGIKMYIQLLSISEKIFQKNNTKNEAYNFA